MGHFDASHRWPFSSPDQPMGKLLHPGAVHKITFGVCPSYPIMPVTPHSIWQPFIELLKRNQITIVSLEEWVGKNKKILDKELISFKLKRFDSKLARYVIFLRQKLHLASTVFKT